MRLTAGNATTPGDFDNDGDLDAVDIDTLSAAIRNGETGSVYDLDGDGSVTSSDRNQWVNVLKNTWFGDSNLDGEMNSGDLVATFTVGEYEDGVAGNSGWADGDWDGNAEFDTSDFVFAFSAGGYEMGPRAATAAVPEPATLSMLVLGMLVGVRSLRRRR